MAPRLRSETWGTRTTSILIATYFQFSDLVELLRQLSGTKVMQVPFDYAHRRVCDFAAGKPVCCAQDDSVESGRRGNRLRRRTIDAGESGRTVCCHQIVPVVTCSARGSHVSEARRGAAAPRPHQREPLFPVQRFARMDYANKRRFPECSCSRKWSILGLTSRRNASISAGVAVWSGSLS
jgi:hypothetical protein